MGDILKVIGLYAGIIGGMCLALLGGTRGCNTVLNNRTINKPAYNTESYATGLTGHVEYTKYLNGSQDVKIYPGLGHRLWDSELHQDLNGNGFVNRIRKNGSELKMNRLSELLVREHDYEAHKNRFDKADKRLQRLMVKYPAKK